MITVYFSFLAILTVAAFMRNVSKEIYILLIALAISGLIIMPSEVSAQGLNGADITFKDCRSMGDMSEYLEKNHNEQLTFQGPAADGGLTSFFMSPNGETWTLTYTFPTGGTCLLDMGTDWKIRYDNHRRTDAY